MKLNGTISPAVIVIFIMILINAGIFFYFDHRSNIADVNLQNQVTQNEEIAEQNRQLIKTQDVDRQIRSDQNCEFSERLHLDAVQDLRGTYQLLESAEANPSEKDTVIYRLVFQNLPKTIADGETDIAPEYCDAQGYGLKEPDPVIPARPKFLPEWVDRVTDRLKSSNLRLDDRPIKSRLDGK